MPKSARLRPFGLRRNNGSSRKGGRRLAAWTAALAVITLFGGVLQTAAAQDTRLPTVTTVDSSANPSVVGQQVTYIATVTDPALGTTIPTGNVSFKDGETPIPECSDTNAKALDENGQAKCDVTYVATGGHSIVATYEGDTNFQGSDNSDGPWSQTVNKADTAIDVESSTDPSKTGEAVVYTASVTILGEGAGTPTGAVTFFEDDANDDPQPIPECSNLNVPQLAENSTTGEFEATCSPTTDTYLAAGTHHITASYAGDDYFNGSRGPEPPYPQDIEKAVTEVGLNSGGPVKTNQQVTYLAVVSVVAPGAGTPTGTVDFMEGTTVICPDVPLSTSGTTKGTASCTTSYTTAGNRSITAEYSGDGDFLGDTSNVWTQVVNLPYTLSAFISDGSSSDPRNAAFRISNGPVRDYTLCVKLQSWPSAVVTPQPKEGGSKWWLNARTPRCRNFNWSSGTSNTQSLYPDFGFAAKGTYVATWKIGGVEVGTDSVAWNTWCPPQGLRNNGVWRPSRHKTTDWCAHGTGTIAKYGGMAFDLDRGFRWNSNIGSLHMEHVGRDHYYPNPTTGSRDLLPRAKQGTQWEYWGKKLKDSYHHCQLELHAVWMGRAPNGAIHLTGAQYNPKTPRISGTWKTYKC